MRYSVFFIGLVVGSGAQAHVGHFGELASHDHWVAAGAIGAAIAVAGWNILKGKKETEAEADAEADETVQEA